MDNIGSNAAARLLALVRRIERLNDEAKATGEDRKEVYTEARSDGFSPKVIKRLVQRRAMDPEKRVEGDNMLELYERVVAEAELMHGTEWTAEQQAKLEARTPTADEAGGVTQGSECQPVEPEDEGSNPSATATPHDPETGEILHDPGLAVGPEEGTVDDDEDLTDIPPFLDRREEAHG